MERLLSRWIAFRIFLRECAVRGVHLLLVGGGACLIILRLRAIWPRLARVLVPEDGPGYERHGKSERTHSQEPSRESQRYLVHLYPPLDGRSIGNQQQGGLTQCRPQCCASTRPHQARWPRLGTKAEEAVVAVLTPIWSQRDDGQDALENASRH